MKGNRKMNEEKRHRILNSMWSLEHILEIFNLGTFGTSIRGDDDFIERYLPK